MEDPEIRRRLDGDRRDDADAEAVLEIVRAQLARQRFGVLATHDGRQAHATLVAFAPDGDHRRLLLATSRATRKYENLARHPAVTLLLDDRENSARDLDRAATVGAVGRVAEVEAPDRARAEAVYAARHPELGEFVAAESTALLVLRVERYDVVQRFQNVLTLAVS